MNIKLLTEHHFGVSKLKNGLHRRVRVYSCQNATLLEITCRRSTIFGSPMAVAAGCSEGVILLLSNHCLLLQPLCVWDLCLVLVL